MNYEETIEWLYAQLPVYQRQGGSAMKKDLTNIRALMAHLGNPHENLRFIHVGGTNGKGSTAHLIAAALQVGGHRVGLYTSPHYIDFRERIKINGQLISQQEVMANVEAMRPIIEEIRPSFFELTVAMSLCYFASQKVDYAVIEVGLGGRLDSTNIITPVLSVITNISKDHTQFLGNTLPAIAAEKAGIIKKEVPVVIGETQSDTRSVFFDKAIEVSAPIVFADQLYNAVQHTAQDDNTSLKFLDITLGREIEEDFTIPSVAPHLYLNATTAFAALHQLHSLDIGYFLDYKELATQWCKLQTLTFYIDRFYRIEGKPRIYVDSGHNEGGLQKSMTFLQSQAKFSRLHIVIGVVSDKDLSTILPLFPKQAQYYFVQAKIARALPASSLAAVAANYGLKGEVYTSVSVGLEVAKASADKRDLIYIGGSIFTAAEVLAPYFNSELI